MIIKQAFLANEIERIKTFLSSFNLGYDNDIDNSWYVEEDGEIIATISTSKNIIKSFAVSENYRGQIASNLISNTINFLFFKGYTYVQVYTKKENSVIFQSLNFYEIISSDKVSLLETKNRSIENTLNKIKNDYNLVGNNVGSIVMNCNPFTLGHKYLITNASKNHDLLIVFIVEEDKSQFKFVDRFNMVKLGVSELENVKVVPSSGYLISSLTFPTYFLKKEDEKIYEQATLDALIFEKYFIPTFNLKRRYLGSEEDLVTKKYNEVLKAKLGDFITIIDRLQYNNENISASIVRKLISEGRFQELPNYVPKTTYDYLMKLYGKNSN